MKRKFLFVLVLFVALTGFKNKELEVSNGPDIRRELFSFKGNKPVITKIVPDGDVRGYVGQIITFYIEFMAEPAAFVEVYKDGVLGDNSGNLVYTEGKATVKIENAELSDTGIYDIVLTNEFGSVKATFKVEINE